MRLIPLAVGLALTLYACVPSKPDLSPIAAAQTFDATPSFDAKLLQHTHHLRHRHPHGHAHAIAYIYNHAALARKVQREYGIPEEITLAVGLLESGKGGSNIATNSNNHFGIKRGDGWQGAVFVCGNKIQWRAYRSVEASYMDFGAYILKRVPSFIAAPSVEAFARTGYAGKGRKAVVYAALLNSIITRYELEHLFSL